VRRTDHDAPDDGRPAYDAALATSFIGKTVLVGLTYTDHKGKFVEQRQMHGVVESADERRGFAVQLRGSRSGEVFWLPPQTDTFKPAPPGEYREHSTGEIIVDPDYVAMWVVSRPKPMRRWWQFWQR